jgi:hypothetical protein
MQDGQEEEDDEAKAEADAEGALLAAGNPGFPDYMPASMCDHQKCGAGFGAVSVLLCANWPCTCVLNVTTV